MAAKPLMNVAEYLVNAMHTGILRDTHFLDKYQGNPDIIYARAMVEPGTKVSGHRGHKLQGRDYTEGWADLTLCMY